MCIIRACRESRRRSAVLSGLQSQTRALRCVALRFVALRWGAVRQRSPIDLAPIGFQNIEGTPRRAGPGGLGYGMG